MLSSRIVPISKENVQPSFKASPTKNMLERNKICIKCLSNSPDKQSNNQLNYYQTNKRNQYKNSQAQTQQPNQLFQKNKIIKKLEVKINDSQFQLKKINEDFAQFKVLSRLQRQKQVRKYVQEYQQLQNKLKTQNNLWGLKFQEMQNQYEQKIKKIKETQIQQKNLSIKQMLIQKQKQFYEKIVVSQNSYKQLLHNIQQQKQILKQKNNQITLTLELKQNQQIVELVSQHQKQMTKAIQTKNQQIKQSQKQNSQILIKKQQTIALLTNTKNNLNQDLYQIKRKYKILNQKNQQYKQVIQNLKQIINKKQKQLQEMQDKYHANQIYFQQKNNALLQQVSILNNKKIVNLSLIHQQQITQFENKIKEIENFMKDSLKFWEQSHNELMLKFNSRPSKIQDIQKIKYLNSQIIKKKQQNFRLKQQLKKIRLQQQNNQKCYNKIFSSNKYTEKREKNSELKDPFTRYLQTLDLKNILKTTLK